MLCQVPRPSGETKGRRSAAGKASILADQPCGSSETAFGGSLVAWVRGLAEMARGGERDRDGMGNMQLCGAKTPLRIFRNEYLLAAL